MVIADFIDKNKLTYRSFGKLVGASASNVRFWTLRATTPSLYHALKIVDITKKKVSIKEMLSFTDEDKYEKN